MNERIKQLWEESQQWNGSDDGRGGLKILESVEKFAELIVRECAGVCESMQLIGPYKEVQDATLKDAVVQIKEHFGVETNE
jgi:hypothetical protein